MTDQQPIVTVEEEHTLSSGDVIVLTYPGEHPLKPWQVSCWTESMENRWVKSFATEAEARVEYRRFD